MISRDSLRYLRIGAMVLLFALTAGGRLLAQTGNGSIHGTVVDQTGGAVPSATVTAVTADGQKTSGTASREGAYDVRGLAPGVYTVQANVTGFAPYSKANVTIAPGQSLTLDITL